MLTQPLRALVLSPSATHPRDYGNRNRVWQTASFLKKQGHEITFVLYPIESDWEHSLPDSYAEMQAAWDRFIVIPPSIPLHQRARGEHHEIDEWWDPQIGQYLSWLFHRTRFDLLFVNYTYLSKAFELAPPQTIKVLDTHDIFSGRKEMLGAHGVEPEFFYTTDDQERIAFDRADIVLAIKDSEREIIRKMTQKRVLSLPYFPADPPAIPVDHDECKVAALKRPPGDTELVVGFIGAENSVNIANMRRFLEVLAELSWIYSPPLRVVIAGNVCRGLRSDSPAVKLVGRVESIDEFYRAVDVVVAPLDFSTGIKIKVGEALAYGKPVVSTANGFDGYSAFDPFHSLPNIPSVCRALIKIASDPERRAQLAERTAMAARMAALTNSSALAELAEVLKKQERRVLFVTDQPFWQRDTLWRERLYQWHDLVSYLAPISCLYVGNEVKIEPPGRDSLKGIFINSDHLLTAADDRIAFLRSHAKSLYHCHCMVSVRASIRPDIEDALAGTPLSVTFDNWGDADLPVTLQGDATEDGADDISVSGRRVSPATLSTVPLRYSPIGLSTGTAGDEPLEVVVVLCAAERAWRTEVEFVLSHLSVVRNVRATVVGRAGDAEAEVLDTEFLHWAARRGRIDTMILIGSDRRMRRMYRSLAAYLGIPCEEIASDRFPCLHFDATGRAALVHSVSELMDRIVSRGCSAPPKGAHDVGWSRLWRMLEAA